MKDGIGIYRLESKGLSMDVARFARPGPLRRLGCMAGLHPVPHPPGDGYCAVECACGRLWLYRRGQAVRSRTRLRLGMSRSSAGVVRVRIVDGRGRRGCARRRRQAAEYLRRLGYDPTESRFGADAVYILDAAGGRRGDRIAAAAARRGLRVLKEADRIDVRAEGGRTFLEGRRMAAPRDVTDVVVASGTGRAGAPGEMSQELSAMTERYCLAHPEYAIDAL